MIPTLQRRREWLRISKENRGSRAQSKPINCNSKTTKEECSSLFTNADWLFISGKLFSESIIPEHQVPLPQESLRFKSLGLFQVYQAPWQLKRPTRSHLPLQRTLLPLRAYAASTWRVEGPWNVVCVFPSPYLLSLKFILPRTVSVNSCISGVAQPLKVGLELCANPHSNLFLLLCFLSPLWTCHPPHSKSKFPLHLIPYSINSKVW